MIENFKNRVQKIPILPILRGLQKDRCIEVVEILLQNNIFIVEIPLTHYEALQCIEILSKKFPNVLIGTGTVLTEQDVYNSKNSGAEFCVSPNLNPKIIHAIKNLGMLSFPGIQTLSEAFTALEEGADGLKLFPSSVVPPEVVESMKVVLPKDVLLIPTGKLTPERAKEYFKVGVQAVGLGSPIFLPSDTKQEIEIKVKTFIKKLQN